MRLKTTIFYIKQYLVLSLYQEVKAKQNKNRKPVCISMYFSPNIKYGTISRPPKPQNSTIKNEGMKNPCKRK